MEPRPLEPVRVSVIVPLYNHASFIEQSLRSVLGQSFDALEVVVVDDGSTDGSVERVQAIGDARVRIIRQPHSGRPAVARNLGLRHARGEYLAFLDSDDLWLAGKLALQVEALDARPDAAMTFGLAWYYDGQRDLGVCGPKLGQVPEALFEPLLVTGNFIHMTGVVARRRALEQLGGFDESLERVAVEDFELWLRVARAYPVLFVPRVLTRYRTHATNLSRDRRQMVAKVRDVIAATCDRFSVAEALRVRATQRWWLEAFKVELLAGGEVVEARRALMALRGYSGQRSSAQLLLWSLDLGLFPMLQQLYRRRQRLSALREAWLRHSWARRSRVRAPR